ncbi:MAG TPA: SDR family oxidoreductase [Gaiellaceae bacterium]|nr:SDR family oxidoreductase [Gaiellaceae bacterium]
MKVLVTGHHGYIGSVCGPLLADAGHEVVGLDSLLYRGCDLASAPSRPIDTLAGDVRDVGPDQLEGFDAVVHLAALSNDPIGDFSPELTRAINFEATVALARAAREAGVRRFVFASSCSMYGTSSDEAVDESAPLKPLTAYAESKVRSEEALAGLAGPDFAPVSMRNATAYGVSPRLRVDLVLNNLVGWAFTTGKVKIMSDGTPWRPLIHVEDISRAALAALEAPEDVIRGEAFNVGRNDENYQVRELGDIVRETIEGSDVEYAGSGDPDPRSYRVSFDKLGRAFPALELTWTARRGAQELADAYRAAQLTLEEFQGDRFTRLKRLRLLLDRGELDAQLRRREAA